MWANVNGNVIWFYRLARQNTNTELNNDLLKHLIKIQYNQYVIRIPRLRNKLIFKSL
jgi:hypothetical protein